MTKNLLKKDFIKKIPPDLTGVIKERIKASNNSNNAKMDTIMKVQQNSINHLSNL